MLELLVLERPVGDLDVVRVTGLLQSLLEFTQLGDLFVERLQTGLLSLQVELKVETSSWRGSGVYFWKIKFEISQRSWLNFQARTHLSRAVGELWCDISKIVSQQRLFGMDAAGRPRRL